MAPGSRRRIEGSTPCRADTRNDRWNVAAVQRHREIQPKQPNLQGLPVAPLGLEPRTDYEMWAPASSCRDTGLLRQAAAGESGFVRRTESTLPSRGEGHGLAEQEAVRVHGGVVPDRGRLAHLDRVLVSRHSPPEYRPVLRIELELIRRSVRRLPRPCSRPYYAPSGTHRCSVGFKTELGKQTRGIQKWRIEPGWV